MDKNKILTKTDDISAVTALTFLSQFGAMCSSVGSSKRRETCCGQ